MDRVTAAERSSELSAREQIVRERAAHADNVGREWAALSQDRSHLSTERRVVALLDDIELEAREKRTSETAAWAWHQVSALNHHLGVTRKMIAERIGLNFGEGTYRSSDGREWNVSEGSTSEQDTEKMLDDVDAGIDADKTGAAYVAALRDALSFTSYSPWRLRSILPDGDMSVAFEQITEGAPRLRPLDPDGPDKELLADDRVRADWADAWAAAQDRCKGLGVVPSPEHGSQDLVDGLAAAEDAAELVRGQLNTWSERVVYGRRPGSLIRDHLGTPVAKIAPNLDTRGPRHGVVDDALARLEDRDRIREAVVDVTSGNPKPKVRGFKALELTPGGYVTETATWRASAVKPS